MVQTLSRRHLLVSAAGLGIAACSPKSARPRRSGARSPTTGRKRPMPISAAMPKRCPIHRCCSGSTAKSRSLIVLAARTTLTNAAPGTLPKQQAVTTFGPFIIGAIGTEVELRQHDLRRWLVERCPQPRRQVAARRRPSSPCAARKPTATLVRHFRCRESHHQGARRRNAGTPDRRSCRRRWPGADPQQLLDRSRQRRLARKRASRSSR